jgi:hypothetical protein
MHDPLRYHRGDISSEAYDESRHTHTWLVAIVWLVPLLGAGAYLLSPQMRRCSYTVPLAFDRVLHRRPFRVYYRWRLHRFTVERAVAKNPTGCAARAGEVRRVPREWL